MQSLDNILKPIGDRFNSPLYGTFLISWCVSNWKIFYVTFIMSAHELSASKLDYIEFYIKDWIHMLAYPLGFTLVFIYAFPILEKKVLEFWYKNKADRKKIIIERMEKAPVSGDEHRGLLMRYIAREEELSGFLTREQSWLKEKEELSSKYNNALENLVTSEKQIAEKDQTISKYSVRNDAKKFFSGRWIYKYKLDHEKAETYKSIQFQLGSSNDIYDEENKNQPLCKIIYFFQDALNNKVYILKEHHGGPTKLFLFNELDLVGKGIYEGREFGIDSFNNSMKPEYVVYNVKYTSLNENMQEN